MKRPVIRMGIAVAVAGLLLAGNIAYAGVPAGATSYAQEVENYIDSIASSIASGLGFSGTQTSETSGAYTYNTGHSGFNAQYEDAQGDTLTIEYCDNGAYVATEETVCSSPPNSCGMVGTGFSTNIVSHEPQVASQQIPCNAQTPSDNLCSNGSVGGTGTGTTGTTGITGTGTAGNSNGTGSGGNGGAGGTLTENGIQVSACSIGYAQEGTTCVFTSCPANYTEESDQNGNPECILNSCSAGYICQSGNQYYQSADCEVSSSPTETCGYGCQSGACLPPPSPEIATWQVAPTLLKSGETTAVQWQADNVSSCSISGTNGDSWTGLSGSETSLPIVAETTYSILCQGLLGASPATAASSTVVNLVPTFDEQ